MRNSWKKQAREWFINTMIFALCILVFSGCVTPLGGGKSAKEKTAAPALVYHEIEHDGRIYVIGDDAVAANFQQGSDLSLSKVYADVGPKGETVVVQVEKKDPSLQARLWAQFNKTNLYYGEEERDDRIYVIGSSLTHLKFLRTQDFPYKKTMVGGGPDGKTLVFEIDKNNEYYLKRLIREFESRHQMKLK